MKKPLLIAVIVLGVLALLALMYFLLYPAHGAPGTSLPTNTFPSGTSISGTSGTSSTSGNTVSITATDGTTYQVPNFTAGLKGSALPAGTYYQLTHNQDTEGANAQFEIQYGTDNSIQIALLKEPLGAARLAAEASLRTFFPLTDAQLCTLNVDIGVPVSINNTLSGRNLGLSFCPGSVTLP